MSQRQVVQARELASPETIGDVIGRHGLLFPDRLAIAGSGFAPLTYRDLAFKIAEIGARLRNEGIGAASRVAIVLPRGPEAAVIGVAVSSVAIGFPINPALSAAELDLEFERARVDAVIVPTWAVSEAAVPTQQRGLGIFKATKATTSLASIALKCERAVPVDRRRAGRPSAASVSVVQFSSGSTGVAKLILVTHANLLDVSKKMRNWFGLSEFDRCACMLPIHSGFGFKIAFLAPLLTGGSVAVTRLENAEDCPEWLTAERPTWFVATPTFLHAVLDCLQGRHTIEHSLRFVASTTSYLPEAVRSGLEDRLGVPVLEFYGLREAGIVAANPAPPAIRKPGTVGRISRADVAVRGTAGEILPDRQIGDVCVRGLGVSPGYIDELEVGCDVRLNPERMRDDWLSTGDLGSLDSDDFLTIVGRTKEIINRGGEKIAPYEIEKALLLHPSVREAAAFAVPHPRLGENVAAAVTLEPDAAVTPLDLRNFLCEHLVRSKIPQHVFIIDAMPRGDTGKISRPKLAEAVAGQVRGAVFPRTVVERQIADIWQQLIGRIDIGIDENFFEAGGDSLLASQMLVELEALLGHPLAQSELQEAFTIRQLAAAVERSTPANDDLLTCAKRGDGKAFFFCHGDYNGRGLYAVRLAELMTGDEPIYLLHPCRNPGTGAELSIQEMARIYLPHLLATCPEGPFRLGGHCNGGLLAWEIAYQLEKAGREVEFVVLIDTASYNARLALRVVMSALGVAAHCIPGSGNFDLRQNAMLRIWHWVTRATSDEKGVIRLVLDKFRRKVGHSFGAPGGPLSSFAGGHELRAMADYLPPKADIELLALVCAESWNTAKYSPVPWKRVARTVRVECIPGDHNSCVSIHAADLAKVLQNLLSAEGKRSAVRDRACG